MNFKLIKLPIQIGREVGEPIIATINMHPLAVPLNVLAEPDGAYILILHPDEDIRVSEESVPNLIVVLKYGEKIDHLHLGDFIGSFNIVIESPIVQLGGQRPPPKSVPVAVFHRKAGA